MRLTCSIKKVFTELVKNREKERKQNEFIRKHKH